MELQTPYIIAPQGRFRVRRAGITAGLVLGAAVVPGAAVLVLGLSAAARRVAAAWFLPTLEPVSKLSRGITSAWVAGFVVLAIGQAVGGIAGPLSMFDPIGLMSHTLFALCGEAVMAAVTVAVVRRARPAPHARAEG